MYTWLSLRFEVGGDILKVEGTAFFSAYLCHFPAGENVQIAGDIAGCRRLLKSRGTYYIHVTGLLVGNLFKFN